MFILISVFLFSSTRGEENKTSGISSTLQPQPSPLLGTAHLRESENTHAHALGKYKRVGWGGAGRGGAGRYFCFKLGGEGAGKNTRRGQWGSERERERERGENHVT